MNKKLIIGIAAVVAVGALIVAGGTISYLSHRTAPVTNTITTGSARITLTEEGWEEGEPQELAPGNSLDKRPVVTNTGSIAVYARVRVTINSQAADLLRSGMLKLEGINHASYSWTGLPDDWKKLPAGQGVELVATLTEPLAAGEAARPIFTGLSLTDRYIASEDNGLLRITVVAEAVQTIEGKSPAECWSLFK